MKPKEYPAWFFYKTPPGRALTAMLLGSGVNRVIEDFLRSGWSRPLILLYARRHKIKVDSRYRSFREFFARSRPPVNIDYAPEHLISPCDGYLTAYTIDAQSGFKIKGSYYRVRDLIDDALLARRFEGGVCLVIRLGASDYHHYCYIDDGYQGENHLIPGTLYSAQPLARESFPVYTLNRRSWCLMSTRNFGPVVQTEIGSLAVGGIVNPRENTRCCRGDEKGHFELAGSTVVLLFQPNHVRLIGGIIRKSEDNREVRVRQGMWIGNRCERTNDACERGKYHDDHTGNDRYRSIEQE